MGTLQATEIVAVILGLAAAWLLGYWIGHKEARDKFRKELHELFEPPRETNHKRKEAPR